MLSTLHDERLHSTKDGQTVHIHFLKAMYRKRTHRDDATGKGDEDGRRSEVHGEEAKKEKETRQE